MISERTLKKWRKEALHLASLKTDSTEIDDPDLIMIVLELEESNKRILKMTQELLDQHLIKRK